MSDNLGNRLVSSDTFAKDANGSLLRQSNDRLDVRQFPDGGHGLGEPPSLCQIFQRVKACEQTYPGFERFQLFRDQGRLHTILSHFEGIVGENLDRVGCAQGINEMNLLIIHNASGKRSTLEGSAQGGGEQDADHGIVLYLRVLKNFQECLRRGLGGFGKFTFSLQDFIKFILLEIHAVYVVRFPDCDMDGDKFQIFFFDLLPSVIG